MSLLTVALLQMTGCGMDLQANQRKGEAYCRQARALGADIALFPEMWSTGYTFFAVGHPGAGDIWRAPGWHAANPVQPNPDLQRARAEWQTHAIGRDDPYVTHFQGLARELGMAIALTYLERWPGAPRNTVSLIDRHGELALTYAKVHTVDYGLVEDACTPGDDFPVCTLDTAAGPVQVGAMICYDREFPETARLLMLQGAELILTPNACTLEVNRLGQFRARAYENMVAVAVANYAAPQHNGHSAAFHPMAFDPDESSRDTLVVEAGEHEGVYLAPFDLAAIRAYRERETWGNTFRRPHRYAALTSTSIQPPFVRVNARGERYDPTTR